MVLIHPSCTASWCHGLGYHFTCGSLLPFPNLLGRLNNFIQAYNVAGGIFLFIWGPYIFFTFPEWYGTPFPEMSST